MNLICMPSGTSSDGLILADGYRVRQAYGYPSTHACGTRISKGFLWDLFLNEDKGGTVREIESSETKETR